MKRKHPASDKPRSRAARPPAAPCDDSTALDLTGKPVWAPRGTALQRLPPEVQHAVAHAIQPLYDEFVTGAPSGVARWLGGTMVHLAWMETIHQLDLAEEYEKSTVLGLGANLGGEIDRCIRLGLSKVHMVRCFRQLAEPPVSIGCTLDAPALPVENERLLPIDLPPE